MAVHERQRQGPLWAAASVQQESSPGRPRKILQITPTPGYGEGDVVTLTFVSVFDSVLLEGAGVSFTIVVLLSVFFSEGGLVTVVSFCSQAASNAAPAKMQIYFFMTEDWTDWRLIYLRRRRWRRCSRGGRLRSRRTCRRGGRFRRSGAAGTCSRRDGFSFLLTSRKQRGASQDADVFLHKVVG